MSADVQIAICATVVVLAAVQSVFGVGLLVFGTPALLLLGLPFEQVLGYLLPCSITVSVLQILSGGGFALNPIRRRFLLLTAPAVIAGTALILAVGRGVNIRPVVGAMMLVTAVTRLLGPVREAVNAFVRRRLGPLLVALGFLHGASNLGGGVLTTIVSSVYRDKEDVRRDIAFGYGLMASLQLATVFVTTEFRLDPALWLALPLLAGLTFSLVGQRLFRATGQVHYQLSLTGLIAVFGLLLLVPA